MADKKTDHKITLYIDTPTPMLRSGLSETAISGHVFVGLSNGDKEERWGYSHTDYSANKLKMLINVIRGSKGAMEPEDANSPYHEAIVWNVTEEQYNAARAKIAEHRKNPGTYKLFEKNCSVVATSVLQAAGIKDVSKTEGMTPYGLVLKKRIMLAKRRLEVAAFKAKNTLNMLFGKKKVPGSKLLQSLRSKPVPVSIRQGISKSESDYNKQEVSPLNIKRILSKMASWRL